MSQATRVLAVIEAATVTGPAKNLIGFARLVRAPESAELAVDMTIATFCRGKSNTFVEAVRAAGIDVQIIPERGAFDRAVLAHLRAVAQQCDPHILQTHGVKSHFLIRLAGLDRLYPWIAFHHGYTTEDVKMRAYNQLDRWSLRRARRVVTVCQPFVEELERAGVSRSRIDVVPNAIDPFVAASREDAEALRERLAIEAGQRIILTIGRLSREKAQIDLLHAAVEIARLKPDLKFRVVIAGDGPERESLEKAAKRLAVRTIFSGHVQDVRPLYALADVFVLPSHREGSPNVLLEAMAAGIPIVATSVGGVPETVRDESSALLCAPGDPKAMAQRILRVLENADIAARLRENGVIDAAARSPHAQCRALKEIYRKVEERNR